LNRNTQSFGFVRWDYIFTTAHRINVITDPSEKTKQSRAAFRKLEELQMPNIPDWTPTEASPEVRFLLALLNTFEPLLISLLYTSMAGQGPHFHRRARTTFDTCSMSSLENA
jgi:hypothetical protein